MVPDSLRVSADSLKVQKPDSTAKKDYGLDDVVDCKSVDSLIFDIDLQKVYMYKSADIDYQTTNLKADYVEIDFSKNLAYARGVQDSTGKLIGTPEFKEGDAVFNAKEMSYNYDTEEGIIKDVRTEEGDGFLHGDVVKKLADNTSNMGQGWYTTCNAEHPHFALRYNKARVIPDDKVVTGLAWIEIEDVPLPIGLPFGLFPLTKGATSGIVIPEYGERDNMGYYLENGGYYWHINDYFDFKLLGSIFTRGSWGLKPSLNYKKRYKYSGSFAFSFAKNKIGQANTTNFSESNDFSIRWNHRQDPKAKPNSTFSANVNIISNKYNTYTPSTTRDYLSNTYKSSVSYSTKLFQKKANLTVNADVSQNTSTHSVDLNLPNISFSANRFYPFQRKNRVGKKRFYEDISLQYGMTAKNKVSTKDTLIGEYVQNGKILDQFTNGMKHTVSAQSPVKILKYINMTNSFSYNDRWYLQSVQQEWSNDTLISGNDTTIGYVRTDTIPGFVRGYDYSFSSSMSTKLYGMVAFKRGPLRAVRHVLSPSVSFSYRPDFGKESYGFYQEYYNPETEEMVEYSIFSAGGYTSPYGGVSSGESGKVSFGLSNNLEVKVRDKNDTITGMRKVKIIDMLSLSTSYDIAKDSLNWSPLTLSGRTKLFNLLNITYNASYSPYAVDSSGRDINKFQYEIDKKLFLKENIQYNLSLSYSLNSKKLQNARNKKKDSGPLPDVEGSKFGTEEEKRQILESPGMYLDWNNPWSVTVKYSLSLGNKYSYINWEQEKTPTYVHTIALSGDVSITPKWKVSYNTNYDIAKNMLSYTRFNIYRDLHCWEMQFSWTPLGKQKGWTFTLKAKSKLLQDLKLTREKDFREY